MNRVRPGQAPEAAPGDGDRRVVEAQDAIRSFLATFGIGGGPHADWLTTRLLARARSKCRLRPERNLVDVALEEADADFSAWALFVLGDDVVGEHSPVLLARAAYHACGGPACWPDVLLVYELPQPFVAAMRERIPMPTPPEQPGAMMEQPLEKWSLAPSVDLHPLNWLRSALS
jgi:hypothetical protein